MSRIANWHERIREAQAALDVALRGDLPLEGETMQVAEIRGFVQKLDYILFEGFSLLRPTSEVRSPGKRCELTLEDLEI